MVKVSTQAITHQPKHFVRQALTPTAVGHRETADRISNPFASRPSFRQQLKRRQWGGSERQQVSRKRSWRKGYKL